MHPIHQTRARDQFWCIPYTEAEFNAAFGIATYTDLPASRYDEAVAFVKRHYYELTGEDLPAVEQPGLEGLDV